MNLWMDIAIPALVTCVVLAGLTIWLALERYRYKTRLDDALGDYTACTVSRNRFKESLETCVSQLDEAIIGREKYRLQLDEALRPKTPPVVEALKKPARTPRAKKTGAN